MYALVSRQWLTWSALWVCVGATSTLIACSGSDDGSGVVATAGAGATSGTPIGGGTATGGTASGATTSTGASTSGGTKASTGGQGGSANQGGAEANGGRAQGGQSSSVAGAASAGSGGSSTSGGRGSNVGGTNASGNATAGTKAASGGSTSGGATNAGGAANATGGRATGGAVSTGGTSGSDSGSNYPATLSALGANGTVGVDWPLVAGASAYRIYWSTTAGVTPQNGTRIEVSDPGEVHAGVTNGTRYYYVVTAVVGGRESQPSPEASATPGGEWVLEFLGHGQFLDLATAAPVTKIPIGDRNHVLLFPEGYLSTDLPRFDTDVTNWMNGVFGLDPYDRWKESFVVWSLPRASATRIGGGNTAFMVPVTASGSSYAMGSGPFTGELATRMWASIATLPVVPAKFGNGLGGMGTVQKATAAVLLLDPSRNPPQAGVSGLTTTVANPSASTQRIATAFGIGHEHEFTHAFARLYDEYMEEDLAGRSWPTDGQSNVVGASSCSSVPWNHLLYGSGVNATDQLVGAFGRAHIGFHSELLCQMNGSHDNATYYGTANLRTSRFCNFCREMVAYRILSRVGLVGSFTDWTSNLRGIFYQRYGVNVPATVPQRTSAGTSFYEACSPTPLQSAQPSSAARWYSSTQPSSAARWYSSVQPTLIGDVLLEAEDLQALGWWP